MTFEPCGFNPRNVHVTVGRPLISNFADLEIAPARAVLYAVYQET